MSDATIEYKPLPTAFKSKGFNYRQLQRVGDVALFEQTKDGLLRAYYEVVIVQRHGEYTIADKTIAPAETMPSTSQWGKQGWTFRDQDAARARFDGLVASRG